MVGAQPLQAAQYRLANFYLDTLRNANNAYKRGGESWNFALAQFEQEWDQIKQWHTWAKKRAPVDVEALALCKDYPQAGQRILALRQNPKERIEWQEVGLEAARQMGDQQGENDYLVQLSFACGDLTLYDQSEAYAQAALTLARQRNDERNIAHSLERLGKVATSRGNYDLAHTLLQESITLFSALDEPVEVAYCLNVLADAEMHRGNYAAARDFLERSLSIKKVAQTLQFLGQLGMYEGDLTAAQGYYEGSFTMYQATGNRRSIANALNSLGNVADLQGNPAKARTYYEESLAIVQEFGDQVATASVSGNLAYVASAQGDYVAARDYLLSALSIFRSVKQFQGVGFGLANIIPVYLKLEQVAEASSALYEGLELAVARDSDMLKLTMLVGAAQLWTHIGKFKEAAGLMGLILTHPSALHENRADVEKLRPQLEAALTSDGLNTAIEAGKTLDLNAVVAHVLREVEASGESPIQ